MESKLHSLWHGPQASHSPWGQRPGSRRGPDTPALSLPTEELALMGSHSFGYFRGPLMLQLS